MYRKHIGIVVEELLKRAEVIGAANQITSITIRCHTNQRSGPTCYGRATVKLDLYAVSSEIPTRQQPLPGNHIIKPGESYEIRQGEVYSTELPPGWDKNGKE
jgi:hypothetical protein